MSRPHHVWYVAPSYSHAQSAHAAIAHYLEAVRADYQSTLTLSGVFSPVLISPVNDSLVDMSGIAPMYNYELHTENAPTPPRESFHVITYIMWTATLQLLHS
jgi:hypothetical protein